ncbi:MAG: hypothetical protein NTV31_09445, partial [Bacteroidia bacterium]|nr:hypothetical protein [Bacteroidia bacterium]
KENDYQELSIAQKVQYGILEFNDVININDEKSTNEAAEYYYEEINLVGKDKRIEYINNALALFNRLVIRYKDTIYTARRDSLMLMEKGIKKELQK